MGVSVCAPAHAADGCDRPGRPWQQVVLRGLAAPEATATPGSGQPLRGNRRVEARRGSKRAEGRNAGAPAAEHTTLDP